MGLFRAVRERLHGRVRTQAWIHDFTLRGRFRCSLCTRPLVGERQKGHVYYRCHTRACPTRGFREEQLETAMLRAWPPIALTKEDKAMLAQQIEHAVTCGNTAEIDRVARQRTAH